MDLLEFRLQIPVIKVASKKNKELLLPPAPLTCVLMLVKAQFTHLFSVVKNPKPVKADL